MQMSAVGSTPRGIAFLSALLATSAFATVLAAGAANAQQAAPPADSATVTEIVVTGTRIRSTGFTAPTPTQVLGQAELERAAQPNIFTAITQLPSLQGSTGATTGTFSTSSGQQGLSSFSLRGLSPIRTLTLLDGQRVVPANVTGVPDISMFPQLLVERVDVVTGGASASYGSDAVGGVVNFVTNKRFVGFKANVATGVTTYGDNHQWLVQVAAGKTSWKIACTCRSAANMTGKRASPRAALAKTRRAAATGTRQRPWSIAGSPTTARPSTSIASTPKPISTRSTA
jgi:iron complex outermembrane receptor protein